MQIPRRGATTTDVYWCTNRVVSRIEWCTDVPNGVPNEIRAMLGKCHSIDVHDSTIADAKTVD